MITIKRLLCCILFLLICLRLQAVSLKCAGDTGYILTAPPKPLSFATNMPGDLLEFNKRVFQKKTILPALGIGMLTFAMIPWDDDIRAGSMAIGKKLAISSTSSMRTYVNIRLLKLTPDLPINATFAGPHDLSSAMYFLGDGWTHMGIAAGFMTYGHITHSYRARHAATAIVESVNASGFVVQLLKHVTGRESPFVATTPTGRWTPFPNQIEYHKRVPHFDAFPSGHIAAATASVTVVSALYPRKRWIKPLGYSLMGVLMFAMVNNGAHWASDYPLGIALGYSFAQIALHHVDKNPKKPSSVD